MNCRKRFASLCLSPSNDFSGRPLSSMLASRSIRSTISRVRLQSHSLTVHLVFSRISSLQSVEMPFILNPLQRSMSSLALMVKGVCTQVIRPSVFLTHCLGSLMDLRYFSIFCTFWSLLAEILSLSMVCSRSISLSKVSLRALFLCSSVSDLLFLIFSSSVTLHISSSWQRILKSSSVLGFLLRQISCLCRISSFFRKASSCQTSFCILSYFSFLSLAAYFLANHPLVSLCMYKAAQFLLCSHISESKQRLGLTSLSVLLSMNKPSFYIWVPISLLTLVDLETHSQVCVSRVQQSL